LQGVNGRIAEKLGLENISVLAPKKGLLKKLYTFVPTDQAEQVRKALFEAGAGNIGEYADCSFNAEGIGTFKGGLNTNPYVGTPGELHRENEIKIEVIFPAWLEKQIIRNLLTTHPYEEVAYDIVSLDNTNSDTGSGVVGELASPEDELSFLERIKESFHLSVIKPWLPGPTFI
jgi:hypothetical protein